MNGTYSTNAPTDVSVETTPTAAPSPAPSRSAPIRRSSPISASQRRRTAHSSTRPPSTTAPNNGDGVIARGQDGTSIREFRFITRSQNGAGFCGRAATKAHCFKAMWLLHHITSLCRRHAASMGLFGLLNDASRQNWRTTLALGGHLGKPGRRKWRTTQVAAVLLSPLDHRWIAASSRLNNYSVSAAVEVNNYSAY